MAGKLKYQVGQRFTTLVPQRLVLGRANGVPIPFGQVASEGKYAKRNLGIDIPKGTIVVLEADFQCQLANGTTKRAYILRVEGQSVFFADRVLSRKYKRVLPTTILDAMYQQSVKDIERIEDARFVDALVASMQLPFSPFGRNDPSVTALDDSDVSLLEGASQLLANDALVRGITIEEGSPDYDVPSGDAGDGEQ